VKCNTETPNTDLPKHTKSYVVQMVSFQC